jgi:hypothetical protein
MVPVIAVIVAIIMSPAVMVVDVKSVKVDDSTAVPVEIESPLVEIEFADVGIAVPLPTFQNFTVAVPESPGPKVSDHLAPEGLPIVQANGTTKVPVTQEVVKLTPLLGVPNGKDKACTELPPESRGA